MNARFLIVIFTVLVLPACAQSNRYANVKEFKSVKGDVLVVIAKYMDAKLAYRDAYNCLIIPTFSLDHCNGIEQIYWSPSGDHFLIESSGEGNQCISIYAIQDIKSAEEFCWRSNETHLPALRTLDPYLHTLSHITWINESQIQFTSVGDFTQFDRDLRRASYYDPIKKTERTDPKQWIWDVKTDTFKRGPK